MTRFALLAAALLGLPATMATAQSPSKSDLAKEILGVWEGPYQSEAVAPGTLKLSVARNPAGAWQVTLEIFSDQAPPASEIRHFKVEADTVSWAQTVAEFECVSKASLVGGVLKGAAECWQNGALALTAGFMMEKKKS